VRVRAEGTRRAFRACHLPRKPSAQQRERHARAPERPDRLASIETLEAAIRVRAGVRASSRSWDAERDAYLRCSVAHGLLGPRRSELVDRLWALRDIENEPTARRLTDQRWVLS
jgi:hypothetical protein